MTSGYGWLALVAPILIAAPGYFTGGLSFGGMIMVVGAFNQVQQALRWFVDNFPRIAEWRATLLRVVALREALGAPDATGGDPGRIAPADQAAERLVLENLSLVLANGRAALEPARLEVAPGERVLIIAERGSDGSALFRAIAGLWPRCDGTIHLPPRGSMMCMQSRPYLPLGTLRAGASYPAASECFDHAAIVTALERVGLCHLVPALDHEERWDKELALEEQQRLAFARLLLHRPRWVLLNDALGAIEEKERQPLAAILQQELADSALVSVGRGPARDRFYDHTLHLRRLEESATLVPLRPRARAAQLRSPRAPAPRIRAIA